MPGVATATVKVTGVLAEGGVRRSRPRRAAPTKSAPQARKFWGEWSKNSDYTVKNGRELHPATSLFATMSASPLLSSMQSAAAAAASPAAAIVPAALLLCSWLARRPASCSSALASCSRRLIMMRSPLCAACPARQCRLPPRSGGLC